jgi:pimeloyl-ACP methyl ester carboxylesterase
MVAPFGEVPRLVVHAPDGTPIAVFSGGRGSGRPALLVHGTGSDHTTWRVTAPLLAIDHQVHAMDRRGRGASGDATSGDGPERNGAGGYTAAREAEDVAAVAQVLAAAVGQPVAVVGHSLGGRLALAATLRTDAIERVVAYEGAPGFRSGEAATAQERLLAVLAADLAAGDRDAVLERFMREAAGLPEDELAAFRASDLWPVRAATAPLIVRELDAALHDPAIALETLAAVRVPVLQLAGSASPPAFGDGAAVLDRRLLSGRIETISGARHNAHHTHAAAFAAAVERFLAD